MSISERVFDRGRLAAVDRLLHGYVDAGRLPFTAVQITQRGEVVHADWYGQADVVASTPISPDAIVRIYSMTKPIASVALLQLAEQGRVLLDNPVSRWIPELADLRVWAGGSVDDPDTVPAEREVTVHDALRHTTGMTSGFMYSHPVDELYRRQALGDFMARPDYDLAECMARLATVPLKHQPGSTWAYGMSTEVVARIVEVESGQRFDDYLRQHIFEPLGMVDTGFYADGDERVARLVPNHTRDKGKKLRAFDSGEPGTYYARPPQLLSGAGGLVSTMADYQRFCDALVGGGAAHGARILGSHTLEWATRNHLPGGASLHEVGDDAYSEARTPGVGFGLGFAVATDPAAAGLPHVDGEFFWGGAASTAFWVDPVNEVTVILLTQLLPSTTYPVREQLRWAVNQALVDG